MRQWLILAVLLSVAFAVGAQEEEPGVILEGYAVLPADTFAEGPESGNFIDPSSNLNGREIPFDSQPVQGVSAIIPAGNGNYFAMSDNGFGAQGNSADYHLRFYEIAIDFEAGSVEVIGFTELSDPNRLIEFPIINNDTEDRILTGGDLDLESFRMAADGTFWFGEEFGPYLLHFDAEGVLLSAPIPTPYPSALEAFARGLDSVQSPQNPAFAGMSAEEQAAAANLPTSRGFEGMALNTSGTMLYTLLEGALFDDPFQNRLLIQEFDIEAGEYTGRAFFYPLNAFGHAIGEMTAINDNEFLVIERDGNQGEAAAFKRIFRVDISQAAPDGSLRKTEVVNLLDIRDVNGLTTAEEGVVGYGEIFTFPFVTIEAVYPVDADTLLVTNDNNYPFSSGRRPGIAPDDNEFILLTLPEALNLAE
jgi:glycerophosphoryl diester phosphodiesterase